MVDLLISHNADVNTKNGKGKTCLHYAVHMKRTDLISSLLAAGADPSIQDFENKTPLDVAKEQPQGSSYNHLLKAQGFLFLKQDFFSFSSTDLQE